MQKLPFPEAEINLMLSPCVYCALAVSGSNDNAVTSSTDFMHNRLSLHRFGFALGGTRVLGDGRGREDDN